MCADKNLKVLYGYSYMYSNNVVHSIVYNIFKTIEERDKARHSHIDDTMIFEAYLLEEFCGKKNVICLDYNYGEFPFKRYFWYDLENKKTYKYVNVNKEWKLHNDNFVITRFKSLYEE